MTRRFVYLLPVCFGLLTASCGDGVLDPSEAETISAAKSSGGDTTKGGGGKGGPGGTAGGVKGTGK